jgi:hypothetical protein
MDQRAVFAALIWMLGASATSCNVATSPGPSTSGACSIGSPYTETVTGGAAGEVSSIRVEPGSGAMDERPTPSVPWCDTSELSLTKLVLANAVAANGCPYAYAATVLPCFPYGMLAVLEIQPTPIGFPILASQPTLVYDLKENPKQKECDGCSLSVWQLKPVTSPGAANWRRVDTQVTERFDSATNRSLAEAKIDHFSVFALVDLPVPEPIQGGQVSMVVASEFGEDRNALAVQLVFVDGAIDASRVLEKGVSPVFRFVGFEPAGDSPDPACDGPPAELLTCLFPIDTEVSIELHGGRLVSIERRSDGLRIEFTADLEIY